MTITEAITALKDYGPWAVTVFIAIAYWHKDRQFMKESREITKQLMTIIESKTQIDTKLESALTNLKEVIMVLVNRH